MKPFEVEVLEKSIEQKGNMLKGCYDDDLFKSWSGDLQKRFPNGSWKTVNGAKVFVNGGKVVAGLDGFNGEIDKFFESKKEGKNNKKGDKPETRQSFFNLPDVNSKKDLNDNIGKILSQYGSRDMAAIQVESYLNENKDIAKEWLKDKNISSRDKLVSYLKSRQTKERKDVVSEKKESAKKWEQIKTEGHLNAIMAIAKEQGEAMDRAVDEYDKKEIKQKIDAAFNVSGKHPNVGLPLKGIKEIYTDEEYKGKKVSKNVSKDAEKLLSYANEGNIEGISKIRDKYFSEWSKSKSKAGTQRERHVPVDTAKVEIYNIANAIHQKATKINHENKLH